LSRLYAQLAALHSQRAMLALSSGIFKSKTTKTPRMDDGEPVADASGGGGGVVRRGDIT
jgi:hypothetical protein